MGGPKKPVGTAGRRGAIAPGPCGWPWERWAAPWASLSGWRTRGPCGTLKATLTPDHHPTDPALCGFFMPGPWPQEGGQVCAKYPNSIQTKKPGLDYGFTYR